MGKVSALGLESRLDVERCQTSSSDARLPTTSSDQRAPGGRSGHQACAAAACRREGPLVTGFVVDQMEINAEELDADDELEKRV